jgi:mitochondrial fission protein ELM1
MPSETVDRSEELYLVEVNGVKSSEHRTFIEALKCGLELKRCFPRSEVKLRDAGEKGPLKDTAAPKRIWGIRSGGQVGVSSLRCSPSP